jgi:hypothetical protein
VGLGVQEGERRISVEGGKNWILVVLLYGIYYEYVVMLNCALFFRLCVKKDGKNLVKIRVRV